MLFITLDTTKSVGSDSISAKMLKCTATSVASPLTTLCNLSISTGVFPSAWKEGKIVPVHKDTNKTLPTGYKPISILPVVSKVIERHIKALLLTNSNSVHQFHLGSGGLCPQSRLFLLSSRQ